jgi:hypothetical protein
MAPNCRLLAVKNTASHNSEVSGSTLAVARLHLCLAVNSLFEFLLGLPEGPGQLRQLCATEKKKGDHENDEKFRATKRYGESHGAKCSGQRGFCTERPHL